MGVYLSSPIRDKISEDDERSKLRYGASSMQGWRTSQEDAHNCCLDFDPETDTTLFACYDGHGGAEVAQYTAQHFPDFLKTLDSYKEGQLSKALEEAFLGFDGTLKEESVIQKLKELAGVEEDGDESEGNHEERNALYEEATMPLEELLSRYGRGGAKAASILKKDQQFQSPALSAKRGSSEDSSKPAKDEVKMNLENELMNGHSDNENNENIERASNHARLQSAETSSSPSKANEAQAKEEKDSRSTQDSNSLEGSSCVDSTTPDDTGVKEISDKVKCESGDSKSDLVQQNSGEAPTDANISGSGDIKAEPSLPKGRVKSSDSSNCTDSQPSSTTTSCGMQEEPGSSSSTAAGSSSEACAGSSSASASSSAGDPESSVVSAGSANVSEGTSSGSAGTSSSVSAGSSSSSHTAAPESTCSSSGGSGSSSGAGGSSDDAGPCSSSKEEPEAGSSSGRTRSKRKNIIPEEGEDESSYDEESSEEDDSEDEEGGEPWASGSENSSDDDDEDVPDMEGEEEEDEDEEEEEEEDTMAGGEEPGSDSGCTAVVALLRGKELYVANAGDSRCVLCRAGKAMDMSVDHKPEDELEHSRITAAGGRVTMDGRVNGGLNLSRAIGDHCYKRNATLSDREQMITALPDIRSAVLEENDSFMVLACDGIWNVMTSQDVVNFVSERLKSGATKLSSICEEMFDFCLSPDTSGDGTGCDNMTCIIVCFNQNATKITNSGIAVKRQAESEDTESTDKTDFPENKKARIDQGET